MTQQSLAVASSVESVVKSRYNGPLLRAAAELWIGPADVVCDVTYGKGNFWTHYQPAIFVKHDLFTVDGVDFRYLPEADGTYNVVVFDPPYIAQGGRETSTVPDFLNRYGLMDVPKNDAELEALLLCGMTECARVLAPSGRLFVKCMDYINGGKLRLGHNRAVNVATSLGLEQVDEFIHHSGCGPQPPGRSQVHSRRSHSFLCIFQKRPIWRKAR